MTLDLEAIKARAAAASAVSAERESWHADGTKVGYWHGGRWYPIATVDAYSGDDNDVVAEFIAAARTDVPALVEAAEWLSAALRAAGVHPNTVEAITHGVTTFGDIR